MAITLIRKKEAQSEQINNIMFKTYLEEIDKKEMLVLNICTVDNELKCLSRNLMYDLKDVSEETFHKKLRIEAALREHLITSHSTNPEWNPENYSKNLDEVIRNEKS
jgi:hypothetical protein